MIENINVTEDLLLIHSNHSIPSLNELNSCYSILADDLQKMNQNVESDSNAIWEALNHLCHKKFGPGNDVKQSAKLEDLQWAIRILPMYANWDKLANYNSLIDL